MLEPEDLGGIVPETKTDVSESCEHRDLDQRTPSGEAAAGGAIRPNPFVTESVTPEGVTNPVETFHAVSSEVDPVDLDDPNALGRLREECSIEGEVSFEELLDGAS